MGKARIVITTLALAAFESACSEIPESPSDGEPPNPSPTSTAATPPAGGTATPSAPGSPTPQSSLPAIFAEAPRTAPAAPIAGGTLLVTSDGTTAVAADPDRNSVFLVDMTTSAVRRVPTEPGEELGRVTEGPPGTVFVAARRGGAVLAIDLASATVRARYPVCSAPRGLTYDASGGHLLVACRSGSLVTLDGATGAAVATVKLDEDLRDVLLANGTLVATRFRSAEILRLDQAGGVVARDTPPNVGVLTPSVAFRGVGLPNGMVLLAHQIESSAALGTGFGAYYGGGCAGGGVVSQVLSLVSVDGSALTTRTDAPASGALISSDPTAPFAIASRIVVGAVGPLDLAVSRDGKRFALVASGNSWYVTTQNPTLFVDALDVSTGGPPASLSNNSCNGAAGVSTSLGGEPVAVAFDAAGKYVVQSREPALLQFEGGATVALSAESHYDTGFAMFHLNTGGGIACASCHPEGGDDGHTWSFSQVGLRRSQALEGGVGERAPFHWSGDLPTFDDLFGEVMLKRMALPMVPPEGDVQALLGWLNKVPALEPADGLDTALVTRGRQLFMSTDVGCATCHSGSDGSDHTKHDVGTGGLFVTPALIGVGLRAPFMHDGCARTLKDRFGLCGGTDHGNVKNLPKADIDALVAFLQSL